MKSFNIDEIKEYYDKAEEIWPESDVWHIKTNRVIDNFLKKLNWSPNTYVLNAGSGGNEYSLPYNFHHVDISDNHMEGVKNFTIANIEKLPFNNCTFDHCICVGSVLNYCDAMAAISELSRVIKEKGELVLEFENSWSYRYKKTPGYGVSAGVITIEFRDSSHTQLIYSEEHIISLCSKFGFEIIEKKRYHIISALALMYSGDEKKSAKYICFDKLAGLIPFFSKHGNNIVFRLKKK